MLADSDGLTLCQAVHLWKFLHINAAEPRMIKTHKINNDLVLIVVYIFNK